MMDRSRSKGDYFRTLERRISDLQKQVDVLVNRDQSIDWIVVGITTGAPAFQNGWGHYGGGWESVAFRKDSSGTVHLRGLGLGALNVTIFTLPVGFRPPANLIFVVDATAAMGRLNVYADGTMTCSVGTPTGYLSFSGVTFRPA
jgi:hypothetical protein